MSPRSRRIKRQGSNPRDPHSSKHISAVRWRELRLIGSLSTSGCSCCQQSNLGDEALRGVKQVGTKQAGAEQARTIRLRQPSGTPFQRNTSAMAPRVRIACRQRSVTRASRSSLRTAPSLLHARACVARCLPLAAPSLMLPLWQRLGVQHHKTLPLYLEFAFYGEPLRPEAVEVGRALHGAVRLIPCDHGRREAAGRLVVTRKSRLRCHTATIDDECPKGGARRDEGGRHPAFS